MRDTAAEWRQHHQFPQGTQGRRVMCLMSTIGLMCFAPILLVMELLEVLEGGWW